SDTVYAAVNYTLTSDVENLFIYGAATAATGNSGNNYIVDQTGTGTGKTLSGMAGQDIIYGGTGNDTVAGGTGDDTLVITQGGSDTILYNAAGLGIDTIIGFSAGVIVDDVINVNSVFATFGAVQAAASQQGADTVITIDGTNKIVLANVLVGTLDAND